MPEFSYFFNANEVSPGVYDRVYLASDFADYFGDVLSSGLLHVDGQPSLKAVVQNGTLETIIEPGRAIIKGYRYKNTTDKVLTHNIADPTLDRIDRFVVRHDLRNSERETVTVIKEGEYAENPVPPALQRDNFIYEISLGQVRVRANTSSLEATDFIDERLDEDLCGLVYSLISIPTDQLQAWITARQAELQIESDQFSTDLADATAQLQQDLLDFAQIFNDWFEEQQGEGFLLASEKGQVNGVGTLNGAGKQPTAEVNTEVADFLTTHPADYVKHPGYGLASGENAKTITLSPAPSVLVEGLGVVFKNATQNTGPVTLNVNSLGAVSVISSDGSVLSSGDLNAESVYTVRYNGTAFILQGESGVKIDGQVESEYELGGAVGAGDPVYTVINQNKLADANILPTNNGFGVAYSNDGVYKAVAHVSSPYITIYKRSGDTFTKLANPSTLPTLNAFSVDFSSNGDYLVVGHTNSPYITIYKRSGDTFTKLANPSALPTGNASGVAFSPDDTYLAVAHATSRFLTIYKRSGDTFTKLDDPSILPTGSGRGVSFSSDNTYLAVAFATSPFVSFYKRSGDTFTKLDDPLSLPDGECRSIEFRPDTFQVAVGVSAGDRFITYSRNGDTFTKEQLADVIPTSAVLGVSYSSDGKFLAITYGTNSPYVNLYKVYNNLSYVGQMDISPTGSGQGLAFGVGSTYLSVAHQTTPFVTDYKISELAYLSNLSIKNDAFSYGFSKNAGISGDTILISEIWKGLT
ncbi:WD40 repeat domain-containing protein [Jeotgalibacillus aurantiacus]|uniref:WD40 repeat domain-containing protein n=1 Tax=Jeotgalibacillus aurantiacus TaxID=2763266 RepID=UPI001D0A3310|nr:hypothetical protein [Jeotgalibacillus aurantiacus]